MGKSTKTKRPSTEADLAEAIGITVERYRRDDWARDRPTVHDGAKIEHPPRRLSRVLRWRKDGWVDDVGAWSLLRYEGLVEASGYGHTRSCCDPTPRGGAGDVPTKVIRARHELAALANDTIRAGVKPFALMVVHALLFDERRPDVIRAALVGGPRDQCLNETRAMIASVAAAMTSAFDRKQAA